MDTAGAGLLGGGAPAARGATLRNIGMPTPPACIFPAHLLLQFYVSQDEWGLMLDFSGGCCSHGYKTSSWVSCCWS